MAEATARCPDGGAAPEAVAGILYTSGTTGPPKGVMLSHRAYVNSAQCFAREMVRATPDDVFFTTLPLFHINAQAHTVLPAILLNATFALAPRFSASGFWDDGAAPRGDDLQLAGGDDPDPVQAAAGCGATGATGRG